LDEDISKIETVYIMNVAERLGVHSDELLDFNGIEPVLELPDREYKLYAIFHRLAILIMIDNSASEPEKHYCFNLGIKMGLHPNAVGEVIQHVIDKGPMNAMPSDIVSIFKKYMN
ncbi:MAG: hypothetical protein C0490_02020, partial [Marivirga sp.]|nr:hypothetical protein [Marivirga sp.]